eukprot:2214214-Pleurochrysis_carterae.AAC.2
MAERDQSCDWIRARSCDGQGDACDCNSTGRPKHWHGLGEEVREDAREDARRGDQRQGCKERRRCDARVLVAAKRHACPLRAQPLRTTKKQTGQVQPFSSLW